MKVNNLTFVLIVCLEILLNNVRCQDHEKQTEFELSKRSKSTIDFLARKSSLRHPHHYHVTPQEKYQCFQLENEDKGDGVLGFDDDLCTSVKKEIIKKSIREVSCGKPRIKLVKLKPPAPNYVLLPDYAKVKRCSGFCHHHPHSCLPTKTSIVKIPVYKVDKTSTSTPPICVDYRLEQHEECQCGCSVLDKHCTAQQIYAKDKCACVCNNDREKEDCYDLVEKDSNRFWDEASCSCQCHPIPCPPGFLWVPQLCSCANMMERDSVSNDDLINTLY